MTANVLILSAAGMLVSATSWWVRRRCSRRSVCTACSRYSWPSPPRLRSPSRVRVVRHGLADRRAQNHPDPLVPHADGGPHRDSPRDRAIPERPCVSAICLGLTVVGYRVSTGFEEGAQQVTHHLIGVALSLLLIGLFLMVTRKKAITQILALLTVENASSWWPWA